MLETLFTALAAQPTWVHGTIILVTILVISQGAKWVVDSASRVARRLGVSELVIGLTLVAMGTSAPEFAVTLLAAFKGQGNVSVGNIVGSNIFNLGFIMGGAAMFRAIPTHRTLLFRDGSILTGASVLLLLMIGRDLHLGHLDGILLFIGLVLYLALLFYQRKDFSRSTRPEHEAAAPTEGRAPTLGVDLVILLLGLVCVTLGSHFLVESAVAIARIYGVSEWVISVTIIAAGTSAPELATTIVGIMHHRFDISAGNLVGSNIFNLLGVLGVAGMLRPVQVDSMASLSLMALLGLVLLVLWFMRTGWRISRWEGGILVLVGLGLWIFDFSLRLN